MTEEIATTDVQVKDYRQLFHLNMTKVHSAKYKGTFICEGKPLHNKEFIQETHTPVKGFMSYGKTKTTVYLNEDDSPIFDTLIDLINHYQP